MIRVYCLGQVMQRFSSCEATSLCLGNEHYIKLMKELPWIYPTHSRYDLFKLLHLAGYTPKDMKAVHDDTPNHTTLSRIYKNAKIPEAYIVPGKALMSDSDTIIAAQGFWHNILSRLQIGNYPYEEPTPLYKCYQIQKCMRENPAVFTYLTTLAHSEWQDTINQLASLPKIQKSMLIKEWDEKNYPGYTKGKYLKSLEAYSYYHCSNKFLDDVYRDNVSVDEVLSMYYNNSIIDDVYAFLYRCNSYACINDYIMEGLYEFDIY